MRVGIISLQHESNTFLPEPTTLAHFQQQLCVTGSAVETHYQNAHHEVAGFFHGLNAEKIEAVPLFAATATPGGAITAEAYRALLALLLEQLPKAGRLDGLLLAPHGAAVSEAHPDMDGDWLARLRAEFPAIPIVATLDPHANLSPLMVASTSALLPYRTNPHIDQYQRGLDAAHLMARTLRQEITPTQAAAFPAVAINIAAQNTQADPCRALIAQVNERRTRPKVIDATLILGFPYADVVEMGSSFVVITDNDSPAAQTLASDLGEILVSARQRFMPRIPGVNEAIEQALEAPSPVCLLDLGDNVGGGSPGDGTLIAAELQRQKVSGSLVCLYDPQAAQWAQSLGPSAEISASLGGKVHVLHGPPLAFRGKVVSVHDGRFTETQIRHGGRREYDMGATAVLRSEFLTVLVHSIRTPPFSLQQLISCGLEPASFRVLVAKGVNAPLAAYGPVCRTFIQVNTPGVTSADMASLPFEKRRRPLFPFENV